MLLKCVCTVLFGILCGHLEGRGEEPEIGTRTSCTYCSTEPKTLFIFFFPPFPRVTFHGMSGSFGCT